MHELSERWTLTMAVIAAVAGVAALAIGAFVAPIPSGGAQAQSSQVITAVFVRIFLALLALILAIALAYYSGYRIDAAVGVETLPPPPSADDWPPPVVIFLRTPSARRDAVFSGAIVVSVYWLMTTLYIVALGHTFGNIGAPAGSLGSYIAGRVGEGIVLALAGAGAGGLGARNAATRRLTRRAFAPVAAPVSASALVSAADATPQGTPAAPAISAIPATSTNAGVAGNEYTANEPPPTE